MVLGCWANAIPPPAATLPLLMDSVIQALAELEQKAPATEAGHTASAWLLSAQDSCAHNPLHHFLLEGQNLKTTKLDPPSLSPELQGLIVEVARHGVWDGKECGVVLASDGSTVAVEPLLAGLEAGLQGNRVVNLPLDSTATPPDAGVTFPDVGATVRDERATSPGLRDTSSDVTCADVGAVSPDVIATDLDVGATFPDVRPGSPHVQVTSPDVQASSADTKANFPTTVDSLLVVTLARDLGLNFLQGPQTWSHSLGTEGCWDQLSVPRTFTLLDPEASTLTTAFLNGALDGALLGDYLSQSPEPRPPLSRLLSQYYGAGVAGDPGFRSNFRRQNGAALTPTPILTQQVWGALILLQRLEPAHPQLQGMSQEQLAQVATHATKEFTEAFLGEKGPHPL